MKISSFVFSDEMDTLAGANILNIDTNQNVKADSAGRFSIDVASSSTQLRISFVGYETRIVNAGSVGSYVELSPTTVLLDEITITNNHSAAKKTDYTALKILAALVIGFGISKLVSGSNNEKSTKEVRTLKI